jgi:hypothetical protein
MMQPRWQTDRWKTWLFCEKFKTCINFRQFNGLDERFDAVERLKPTVVNVSLFYSRNRLELEKTFAQNVMDQGFKAFPLHCQKRVEETNDVDVTSLVVFFKLSHQLVRSGRCAKVDELLLPVIEDFCAIAVRVHAIGDRTVANVARTLCLRLETFDMDHMKTGEEFDNDSEIFVLAKFADVDRFCVFVFAKVTDCNLVLDPPLAFGAGVRFCFHGVYIF